jgi:hypothetical protein
MEKVLLEMVKKTLDQHVLPKLKVVTIVSISFDLWMSCGGVALVIYFLNETSVLMHDGVV